MASRDPTEAPQHAQEGLEAVVDQDSRAPEVVAPPLYRSHSLESPETLSKASHGAEGDGPSREKQCAQVQENGQVEKRYCGLRRRAFIISGFVITLAVIIAVILAAVLSITLPKKSHSGSTQNTSSRILTPLKIRNDSGVAMLSSTDHVFGYYQDENGTLSEVEASNGTWSLAKTVATDMAASNSPLAASEISTAYGTTILLFFLNSNGEVMMTNRTPSTDWYMSPWTTPISILYNDQARIGSPALESVLYPGRSNDPATIRVYYGSTNRADHFFQVGLGSDSIDARANTWDGIAKAAPFNQSDNLSGIGGTSKDETARLYIRNSTTGLLTQWSQSWGNKTYPWQQTGNATESDPLVANGTSITATTDQDGTKTDYVFYQTTNNSLICAIAEGANGFSTFYDLGLAVTGTKLRAWYNDTSIDPGAVLYYQKEGDGELNYLQIDRSGRIMPTGIVMTV